VTPEHLAILLCLLALIPAYYLGIPLIIRLQQQFPAHPTLTELDFEILDPSLARFLMTRTKALFTLGFDEPTLVHIPDLAPQVTTYLIMLVNRQTGDKAMVTALVGRGPVPLQTLYLEFSTRFENGQVFDTNNSSELGAFPPTPLTIRTKVPTVNDPKELYQLHTFVMSKHGVRASKVLYEPGRALDYLVGYVLTQPFEQQIKRGWLYYDQGRDCYRPTLKGSYLIAWGLMWPFKGLRTMALQRRERRILEEFDHAPAS
jgi:hypothetical protein